MAGPISPIIVAPRPKQMRRKHGASTIDMGIYNMFTGLFLLPWKSIIAGAFRVMSSIPVGAIIQSFIYMRDNEINECLPGFFINQPLYKPANYRGLEHFPQQAGYTS